MKLKGFYTAKETINKIKRQPTECKNIFPKKSVMGFISKIYFKKYKTQYQQNKQPN